MSAASSASPTPTADHMSEPPRRLRRWLVPAFLSLLLLLLVGVVVFWGDLVSTALDPKVPFQTYDPPPAPDYAKVSGWYMRPAGPEGPKDSIADVFFVAPTTYDGGRNWNARVDHPKALRQFREVMEP